MTTTATCPVCNGTSRAPAPEVSHKSVLLGYNGADDTVPCRNCGGQTMSGIATGETRIRPDGTPCRHEYQGRDAGRCLVEYACTRCGDAYSIDLGD